MTENVALLLVDDRPENLVALEAVLGNQGLDLVKVSSGNDALRHTLKQDFALVLLDVQMPGMDGFETAELMRSNPKTRHLPIIFVTAGMKDIQLQFKGYELGAVDYLIKPFEPHILQSKVKVFCELYRQRRQLESNQLVLESKIRERVAELKESEERFRMLATHAPVGIYQIDTQGNCLFVNRRWCEIAGLSTDEAVGQEWTRTIHPDDKDAVASIWRQARSPEGEWSMDYRFLRPDGKIVWVHGNAVALCNEKGEITGYLGNNLEITVRKRDEERQRSRSAVTGRLAEDATLSEILHLIAVGAERQAHGMTCSILILDEPGQQLVYGAAPNLPDRVSSARTAIGDGAGASCAATANHGKRMVVDDIHAHPACEDCRPPALTGEQVSCWSEPILAMNGDVLGVFAFYWPQPTAPDADDMGLMHEAAQLAGLAIERKRTENELQIAASVHQAISEAITVTDANNRIIAINPAFTQVTGYAADEVIGQGPGLLKSGRHDLPYYQEMWQTLEATGRWQGEIWNRRKSGEVYPEWLSINTIHDSDGKVLRRIAMFSDITEKKRSEETIWRQANYDSLTELPNRRLFRDRLQQEILKAQRADQYVALLFVDLDRFKEVNDTLGHHTGDLLLIEAARRVCECVRATDTVARLGGDEFTVIMSDLADTDRVGKVAQSVLLALAAPFLLGKDAVYVSASIGITIFPSDADNVESLLKNADQAMYAAKEHGRNRFSYFTASMQEIAQTRLLLSNDLRNAIAAGQLEVYLQPIVELATGRIFKAEALLRWHHPTHGMVGPAHFIPIAEETGLINEIGDWVFKESARTAKRWFDAGLLKATDDGLIQISVNKSPRQFFSGNTHETWIDYLEEIGLPAKCIAIEITEGLLLDDRPEVAERLLRFREAGFRVSLDDFGTGYSAMSYLKKFPLDFLKIDQSFVRDMVTDHGDQAIVEAIIVMAHKLGLKVIAEGIETTEQCEMLKAAGCDYGQGYLFARPMPAAEMTLTT
ncbi:MAG: EAL domain-containing protein [Sulfuritalea sp.]|jgi:diguanylate cyclase (GGDEF)-like protein/PAS domain S-box-containing protein|nr:EAL domain-containing protein [Sulfuritalea sp.]